MKVITKIGFVLFCTFGALNTSSPAVNNKKSFSILSLITRYGTKHFFYSTHFGLSSNLYVLLNCGIESAHAQHVKCGVSAAAGASISTISLSIPYFILKKLFLLTTKSSSNLIGYKDIPIWIAAVGYFIHYLGLNEMLFEEYKKNGGEYFDVLLFAWGCMMERVRNL